MIILERKEIGPRRAGHEWRGNVGTRCSDNTFETSTWLMQICDCPVPAVGKGAGEEVFNTSLVSSNRKETQGGSVAGAGLPGELLAALGKARGALRPPVLLPLGGPGLLCPRGQTAGQVGALPLPRPRGCAQGRAGPFPACIFGLIFTSVS